MLNPQNRTLLLENLRPPPGYNLDHAVGCTFSLDLHALLTTPLAFTFFDWEEDDGNITTDPLTLLESVRRQADRITIFCQAGQISVPRKQERIFAYLENSVHEVLPPNRSGVFHPKIWLIRYTHTTEPTYYRFICLSRNLTFDKSWDTVLVLDGLLTERAYAYGVNNPIGDFIKQLPGLAITSADEQTVEKIDQIQHEVRRVLFDSPEGVENLSFHPIGIPGYNNFSFSPPKRRILIMSPFLSENFLNNLAKQRQDCFLISRQESLDTISQDTLQHYDHIFTLSREAETEEPDEASEITQNSLLSGLHAKLFVMDDGWKANVWTGSANATDAAFNTNVEFLVCIRGKRSDLGINKMLGLENGKTNFADLLHEYRKDEQASIADTIEKNLEKTLRETRLALTADSLFAEITASENGQKFHLEIKPFSDNTPTVSPDVKIRCWPVTLRSNRAITCNFADSNVLSFNTLSIDALTAFFAFELECSVQGKTLTERFVTKLILVGEPEGRLQKLLRSLLKNKTQVLRLLLLLLSDQSTSIADFLDMHRHLSLPGTTSNNASPEIPLLESLMKTLANNPSKLDRISRLVNDLRKTGEGDAILPDGFMQIWEPIWQARKEMHK